MDRVCLQLEHFEMKKLHVDFFTSRKKIEPDVNMKLDVKVRLNKIPNKPRHFKLLLSVRVYPEPKTGYHIRADILGCFFVPEPISKEIMGSLVKGNGTLILYGILRGELAVFTGSFPGGKLTLPTIPIPPMSSQKA